MDGKVDFYRNWKNYKLGFGDVNAEHWLGNQRLSLLTALYERNELRVDVEAFDQTKAFAQYAYFHVGPEKELFALHVGFYNSKSSARKYFTDYVPMK